MTHRNFLRCLIGTVLGTVLVLFLSTGYLQQPAPLGFGWVAENRVTGHTIRLIPAIHASSQPLREMPNWIALQIAEAQILAMERGLSDEEFLRETKLCIQKFESTIHHKKLTADARRSIIDSGLLDSEKIDLEKFSMTSAYQLLGSSAMQRAGVSSSNGLDESVRTLAKKHSKQVAALETPCDQVKALFAVTSIIDEASIKQRIQAIKANKWNRYVDAIPEAWKRGDIALLIKELEEFELSFPKEKEANDLFIRARDKNLTQELIKVSDTHKNVTAFIGVFHLVGSHSVVELLAQRGFSVSSVKVR